MSGGSWVDGWGRLVREASLTPRRLRIGGITGRALEWAAAGPGGVVVMSLVRRRLSTRLLQRVLYCFWLLKRCAQCRKEPIHTALLASLTLLRTEKTESDGTWYACMQGKKNRRNCYIHTCAVSFGLHAK